jgi:hypothetical protein
MNPELATLKTLLAQHDWTYDRSDDYTAWTRGQTEARAIQAERRRLISTDLATEEEVTALTDRYRPKGI